MTTAVAAGGFGGRETKIYTLGGGGEARVIHYIKRRAHRRLLLVDKRHFTSSAP